MKKLIIRGVIFIALLFVPVLAVNYYVDSYVYFRLTYDKIGRIGVASNYSVNGGISERKAKWAKIIHMDPVENVVFGSSRSLLFSSDNLGIDNFFNLSVSNGCVVDDYMAEVYILQQNNKMPTNLLIEITPVIFNGSTESKRYLEWGESTAYMNRVLDGESCNDDDSYLLGVHLKDVFSPSYFKYNFEQLVAGKRTYIEAHDMFETEKLATFHVDGSYTYSKEFQSQYDVEFIAAETQKMCEDRAIRGCYYYDGLDPQLVEKFEKLMAYLKSIDCHVSFYLPPYSEYIYDYMCTDDYYHAVFEVEDYILKYAESNNLQVYGSYDPSYCGITFADLYDPYHVRIDRVVDTLWPRFEDAEDVWKESE